MVSRPRIYLAAPLDSKGLSIYSTNLYQGATIPIFGNKSIGRILAWSRCSLAS